MSGGLHLVSCFLGGDPFVDRFLGDLHDALDARGDRLILLPTYEPAPALPQHIRIAYDVAGFRDLAPSDPGDFARLLPTALAQAQAAWSQAPVDADDFLASASACSRFYGCLLDELEPDTVMVWNPSVPQGRLLQMACLARALPFWGIERGVFGQTLMVESLEISAQSDLVMNPTLHSMLQRCPEQPERLAAIRQHYAVHDQSRYPAAQRRSAQALREALGLSATTRIAVLMLSAAAANWAPRALPGARFNSPWMASAEQAVRQLADALPDDTVLVVQGHPIDRDTLTLGDDERVRLVHGEHLHTLFDAADVLVFLGATTVQHEALLSGKPVVLLSRSQLSGQGVAYEYRGGDLGALLARALPDLDQSAHLRAISRYVPALFDHALYGGDGSPARLRAPDLATHLGNLVAAHDTDIDTRIQRWLDRASQDLNEAAAMAAPGEAP